MKSVTLTISFINHFIQLFIAFYVQKKHASKLLKTLPHQVLHKKICVNYSVQIVSCIAQFFCTLRGHEITLEERNRQTYLSFLAALIDAEIDANIKKPSDFLAFLQNTETISAANQLENISFLISMLKSKHLTLIELKQFIKNCLALQLNSLKQKNTNCSVDELKEITWSKCGISFLLSRLLLNSPLKIQEKEFCIQYGGIGQLGDDILDIYDDNLNNIQTIPQLLNSTDILSLYLSEVKKTFAALLKLNYQDKKRKKTAKKICIVLSIPLVGLEQLNKNKINTGVTFSSKSLERKKTICDMQKTSTIVRSMHYSKYLYRLFLTL